MGILDFLTGEFIDVIHWTDDTRDTMVWRFERQGHAIKYGAKLTVREGQAAVFVHEGQIADVFTPGLYMLETNNMPILTTLQHWDHGFRSPFNPGTITIRNLTNYLDSQIVKTDSTSTQSRRRVRLEPALRRCRGHATAREPRRHPQADRARRLRPRGPHPRPLHPDALPRRPVRRRMGAHIVDAPIDRIGPALLNAYLDVKRRDLL